MPQGLARFLRLADGAMLAYWLVNVLACLNLLHVPHSVMYAGYGTPQVDAWNWSFAPLDVAFAMLGFTALHQARNGHRQWRALAIASLVLTMCAGGMAVSYWAIAGDFAIAWWLPNLVLLGAPLIWLPRLMVDLGRSDDR